MEKKYNRDTEERISIRLLLEIENGVLGEMESWLQEINAGSDS